MWKVGRCLRCVEMCFWVCKIGVGNRGIKGQRFVHMDGYPNRYVLSLVWVFPLRIFQVGF